MRHQDLTINHRLESWVFADAAARGAAGTYTPDDIGRIGFQVDTGQYWRLMSSAPSWQIIAPTWPIGSVYISVLATNPAALLGGGTWVQFGQGRMLVGQNSADPLFDTPEETGGSAYTGLSVVHLPAHTHDISHTHAPAVTDTQGSHIHTAAAGGSFTAIPATVMNKAFSAGSNWGPEAMNAAGDHQHNVNVPALSGVSGATGSGAALVTISPYIVVYMWKRTA